MNVFDHYARYYDLLYRDKNYDQEAMFVHECFLRHGGKVGHLLELGCGTGRHAMEFAALNWNVKGYDRSAAMVESARIRAANASPDLKVKVDFATGDIRKLREPRLFDAVISLFHVISYQTTNSDLANAFTTAAAHLKPGGLFLFDFWYGAAVVSDPPQVRVKRLKDDKTSVTRLAEPDVDYSSNLVSVKYEVLVEDLSTHAEAKIHEEHLMRYWFLPELEYFLNANGFTMVETGPWMGTGKVDNRPWFVWLMARKM